jgi:hypothetical protein
VHFDAPAYVTYATPCRPLARHERLVNAAQMQQKLPCRSRRWMCIEAAGLESRRKIMSEQTYTRIVVTIVLMLFLLGLIYAEPFAPAHTYVQVNRDDGHVWDCVRQRSSPLPSLKRVTQQ